MSLVSITAPGGDAELLDAHLAFHLNAGSTWSSSTALGGCRAVAGVLEPYERSGHVRRASGSLTELGRLAVAEYGAEWLSRRPSEFWWPRGESLKDVLAVIPPRYASRPGPRPRVRRLAAARVGSSPRTGSRRVSLLETEQSPREPLARMLRPLYRAIAEHRDRRRTTGRWAGDACPSGPGTRSKCSGLPRPPRSTKAVWSTTPACATRFGRCARIPTAPERTQLCAARGRCRARGVSRPERRGRCFVRDRVRGRR